MEHLAKVLVTARGLGRVRDLPPSEAAALRRAGLTRYGGPPAAVAMADQSHADLPPACRGCSGCGQPSHQGIAPPAGFSIARFER